MAMRWRAALSWRLPVRLRRIRPAVLPDQAGMGAVPLWRAKAASLVKRVMPADSPTSLAAVSSPQPGSANKVGDTACTAVPIRWVSALIVAVRRTMSASSSAASSARSPSRVASQSANAFWVLARSRERFFGLWAGRVHERDPGTG